MKRDKEKSEKIKNCVKNNYMTVSDGRIAQKFGVTVRTVAEVRRKLGLSKTQEMIDGLKVVKERRRVIRHNRRY